MLIIQKKSAISVFYGLISVDGEIGEDELQKLDELGNELDPECFAGYRDEVIAEGQAQQEKMIDDEDLYDVIAECVQDALRDVVDDSTQGVPSRLLLWNMLTLAFSNGDYDAAQRRLIKHVARVAGIPASVFLEMEQLMQTYVSVENERAWLKTSQRPYAEIEPIVEELNDRIRVLAASAEALIGDELLEQNVEALTYRPNAVENAMSALGEKMEPMLGEIGNKTNEMFGVAKAQFGSAATAVSAGFGKQKDRFLSGLKNKKKHNSDEDAAAEKEK